MPLRVNIDKAKDIFKKNLQSSIDNELKKIEFKQSKGDDRYDSVIEYYKNLNINLDYIPNVYELNMLWPEILPFCPHNKKIFNGIDDRKDDVIAYCTIDLDYGRFATIQDALNISFMVDISNDEFMFFPVEEISNLDNTFEESWFWNESELNFQYKIYGSLDRELGIEPNRSLIDKRILLQNNDNSVKIVTPVCCRIDIDELIAKLTYIPEENTFTHSEVFNLEELPDPKYRDAWELIK